MIIRNLSSNYKRDKNSTNQIIDPHTGRGQHWVTVDEDGIRYYFDSYGIYLTMISSSG